MDREAVGITLMALALCTASWFFERYVAAISLIVALGVLFGYRGLLLKPRDAKLTVARKLPHVGGGLIVSGLLLAGWRWLAIGLTSAATFGYLYLIMNHGSNRGSGILSNLAFQYGLIMDNGGKPVYLSSTFYAFSAIALLLLLYYPKPAIGGILTLTVSDTVAAVVGLHGKLRIQRLGKTLEGSVAMFVSSALILTAIGVPFYTAGIVALCATIIEMLPLPVDDNFLIPLIVGMLLEALII